MSDLDVKVPPVNSHPEAAKFRISDMVTVTNKIQCMTAFENNIFVGTKIDLSLYEFEYNKIDNNVEAFKACTLVRDIKCDCIALEIDPVMRYGFALINEGGARTVKTFDTDLGRLTR